MFFSKLKSKSLKTELALLPGLVIPICLLLRCVLDGRCTLGKLEASMLIFELFFAIVAEPQTVAEGVVSGRFRSFHFSAINSSRIVPIAHWSEFVACAMTEFKHAYLHW